MAPSPGPLCSHANWALPGNVPAIVCSNCLLAEMIFIRDRASPSLLHPWSGQSSNSVVRGVLGVSKDQSGRRTVAESMRTGKVLLATHPKVTTCVKMLLMPNAPCHQRFTVIEIYALWTFTFKGCLKYKASLTPVLDSLSPS